jgi:hypothetical protein
MEENRTSLEDVAEHGNFTLQNRQPFAAPAFVQFLRHLGLRSFLRNFYHQKRDMANHWLGEKSPKAGNWNTYGDKWSSGLVVLEMYWQLVSNGGCGDHDGIFFPETALTKSGGRNGYFKYLISLMVIQGSMAQQCDSARLLVEARRCMGEDARSVVVESSHCLKHFRLEQGDERFSNRVF